MKKIALIMVLSLLALNTFAQEIPSAKVIDSQGNAPEWTESGEGTGTHNGEKVIFFVGTGQSTSRSTAQSAAELNASASAAAAVRALATKQVARAWEVIGTGDSQTKQQVMKGLEAISSKNINVSGLIKIGTWWRQVVTPKVSKGKFAGWNKPVYEYYIRYAMNYEVYLQRREQAIEEAAKRAKDKKELEDARGILSELDAGKEPSARQTQQTEDDGGEALAQSAAEQLKNLPRDRKTVSEEDVKPKAVAKAQVCSDTPDWFYQAPKDSGFYYFAGVGQGSGVDIARNAAVSDIFSQIVYMVNASITANSSFEQYVSENEKEAKRNSAVFKKVRSKGDAVIQNFEIQEQCTGKTKDDTGKSFDQIYVLAKIPKSEITSARQRMDEEKAKRKANPMGVFAFSVYPDGKVEEIDSVKGTLESIYQSMGYSIKTVDLDFEAATLKNAGKIAAYLKQNAGKVLSKALVCVITPSQTREETLAGRMKITSYLGSMTVREIDLSTGEILSSSTFDGKGVSMRKDSSKEEDAFRKLIQSLVQKLLEGPGGEEKSGGYDDYN